MLAGHVKLLCDLDRRAMKILHRLAGNFWPLRGLKSVENGITCDIMDFSPPTLVFGPQFHYTPRAQVILHDSSLPHLVA